MKTIRYRASHCFCLSLCLSFTPTDSGLKNLGLRFSLALYFRLWFFPKRTSNKIFRHLTYSNYYKHSLFLIEQYLLEVCCLECKKILKNIERSTTLIRRPIIIGLISLSSVMTHDNWIIMKVCTKNGFYHIAVLFLLNFSWKSHQNSQLSFSGAKNSRFETITTSNAQVQVW